MRDDNFLQGRLDFLWDRYFADVGQTNDVVIKFGRKTRSRLGSIKQGQTQKISNSKFPLLCSAPGGQVISNKIPNQNDRDRGHRTTIITINGLFKEPSIPEFLIDSVIAHEMVHYAHGFASPHEKKYDTPHAGGVIKKEMQERGLEDLYLLQKKWLKENWREFADKHLPRKVMARKRRRRIRFVLR